jgi:hypothetical protein
MRSPLSRSSTSNRTTMSKRAFNCLIFTTQREHDHPEQLLFSSFPVQLRKTLYMGSLLASISKILTYSNRNNYVQYDLSY